MDLLRPNTFGEKNQKKEPPPDIRPRDGHIEHVQDFRGYFLKTAWTFGLLCGKLNVYFA